MAKVKRSGIPPKHLRRGISVVVTVLNEEKTIKELLDVLVKFPAEIIIVDGGSSDQTPEIIKKYSGVKLICGKYNRSQGRNIGVAAAKGEIIAFTDAGCVPERDWLKNLTKVFFEKLPSPKLGEGLGERYLGVECVSGYYKGLPQNIFEKCLVPYVLVMPDRIGSEFLPSTRSMAITKKLFLNSGGFDEKLWHNEDYAFANKLKKMGVNFNFASQAIVGWLPSKDLKSAAWMFLRFAIGDAQAGIMRPKVKLLILRYYLFFFLVFIYLPFAICLFVYLIWAVLKNYRYVKDVRALYWLPVLQLTADCMVIFGTVMGLLSRPKK